MVIICSLCNIGDKECMVIICSLCNIGDKECMVIICSLCNIGDKKLCSLYTWEKRHKECKNVCTRPIVRPNHLVVWLPQVEIKPITLSLLV